MEIEKQEYIHIKMHKLEAETLDTLLYEVERSQDAPDSAKAKAIDIRGKLQKAMKA